MYFGSTPLKLTSHLYTLDSSLKVQYRLKASVWPYKNAFLKTISGKGDLYGENHLPMRNRRPTRKAPMCQSKN